MSKVVKLLFLLSGDIGRDEVGNLQPIYEIENLSSVSLASQLLREDINVTTNDVLLFTQRFLRERIG